MWAVAYFVQFTDGAFGLLLLWVVGVPAFFMRRAYWRRRAQHYCGRNLPEGELSREGGDDG